MNYNTLLIITVLCSMTLALQAGKRKIGAIGKRVIAQNNRCNRSQLRHEQRQERDNRKFQERLKPKTWKK